MGLQYGFILTFLSILWGCILSFPYILLAHSINSSKKQKEKALDLALTRLIPFVLLVNIFLAYLVLPSI